jgi:hypothetical protein
MGRLHPAVGQHSDPRLGAPRCLGARELLAGVGDAQRIEGGAQPRHAVHLVRVIHGGKVFELLDANAVLAGDRAAHLDAQLENAAGQRLGAREGSRLAAIKQDEWMEIAIAGVKDVCDAQPGLVRHFANTAEGLTELAARHHAVLHDEVGRKPAHGAESALAALPDSQAFFGVTGRARFHGFAGGDDGIQSATVRGDSLARALQLNNQDGLAAGRVFGVDGGDGGFQGERIHDLDCARQQPAGNHGGDGITGLLERAVAGQDGVEAFGLWEQLQRDLQRDAEETLAPAVKPTPVGADDLPAGAAPLDDFAGGQHRLETKDVVGGHAVF